jgi:hypothetical protein
MRSHVWLRIDSGATLSFGKPQRLRTLHMGVGCCWDDSRRPTARAVALMRYLGVL